MADRRTDGPADELREPAARPAVRLSTLVIQTAFLGDVVLTTPLLSALSERSGPVDVLTTPAAATLLEGHPAVRTVIRYDKHGLDRGFRELRRVSARLRAGDYSAVYLPHRSFRSALLALLTGAPNRIGFAGTLAAALYTTRVPRPATGHEVERLLTLLGGTTAPPVSLGLTSEDHATAEEWLQANGVPAGFVALAPGSIWGTKRWPYYPELAAGLDRPSVVVGGAEDSTLAMDIVAAAPGRAASATGKLSLRASAALISRAAALVTNDSAPLHLATAVGTPVVAVFGPTIPQFGFGPRGVGDVALGREGLSCRPCSRHGPQKCPLGHHRCMRDQSVETVAAALVAVLSREESRAICPRS